jgi:hypothetical protein
VTGGGAGAVRAGVPPAQRISADGDGSAPLLRLGFGGGCGDKLC